MSDTRPGQPVSFVGWWEAVFHIRNGERTDVTGIIEHIDADGRFTVFRDGERIGAGRHVEFTADPDGFTNEVQEVAGEHAQIGRELAVYRFSDELFEVCKASEHRGRPTEFASPSGSGWTHAAIRRISDDDPRIPARPWTEEVSGCCDVMAGQLALECSDHPDLATCPDAIIVRSTDGEYRFPIRDGGSSFLAASFCPWCGARL